MYQSESKAPALAIAANSGERRSLAQRIGPGFCAVAALVGAFTGSTLVIGFTLATALIGVVAANHPVESAYNWMSRAVDRAPLPAIHGAKLQGIAISTPSGASGRR